MKKRNIGDLEDFREINFMSLSLKKIKLRVLEFEKSSYFKLIINSLDYF